MGDGGIVYKRRISHASHVCFIPFLRSIQITPYEKFHERLLYNTKL